ncbi:hypothetical protein CK203_069836 [Vitis vinifera]|uniref:DUF4283 domain-containing protein n=1 Tax=Vitis vinifera TaxID=29760 RepID=A0A438E042_VITVI|nr:hypothetical protein CK203_069836 [Vitis vinifera]
MATREITKRRSGGKGKEIVSGWSRRLGPASIRLFLEGLDQCVKNGKEDKWEKGWKKKGRSYSMVRKANKGLKRKLGLAWLEESQVLLEFEFVEEARRVLTFGKKVGGWDSGRSRALESKLRVFGRKRNKRRSLSEDHGLANITLVPVHSEKGGE